MKKEERLSGKKTIEYLFREGESMLNYPFKIVFVRGNFGFKYGVQVAFSVGKRAFKKAVQRNAIKRKMRESYRLNKSIIRSVLPGDDLAVFFIYIGKEMPDYKQVNKAMIKSLSKIKTKLCAYEGGDTT